MSEEFNDTFGINEIVRGYQMKPSYWNIDEYDEKDDLNDYNVVVNRHGIPILINTMTSFFDFYDSKKGIYVLTLDGKLRMGFKMHHSDLMHGQPIQCAGEFRLNRDGVIISINNRSGHYMPFYDCLDDVLDLIRQNGFNGTIKIKQL